MKHKQAQVKVRGGEVPQNVKVPAWASRDFALLCRNLCHICETSPQRRIKRTRRILRRIKAVIHGLPDPQLKPKANYCGEAHRHFKLNFKGM